MTGWETKVFWHSPELGSLLYSQYKIPLAQACFPLGRPNFHSHWRALVSQPVVTLYFHSWQYLVRGWLYRDIIFSPLTVFRQGVIISWHYIFTPGNIWWGGWLYRDIIFWLLTIFGQGVIMLWHYIFTPDSIRSGGDHIVTLYFHSWQYLVRGVIISWHYIFIPNNIWRGDYIVTIYFHPWQYLVTGWIHRDIIFSLLTIFGQGVIISWHHIFTPGNIWWGDDYIVTLYFHSWQYLVRGWLYRDIFSLLKIFGEGVIISWHYNIISDTTLESGTGGDYIFTIKIWLCSDTRVLLFISIYSPHETWGFEVIIFKHDTLFAVETQCFGGFNGLYQQSVINKSL